MFCTDVLSIESLGKPQIPRFLSLPWLTGQLAIVTARFSIPGYTQDGSDQSATPFTKLSCAISGEILTLPNAVYWFADGTPLVDSFGIVIPQIEYTLTRYKMPYIPDVAIASLLGCVNSDTFAISRTFSAAPGTCLFMGGSATRWQHPGILDL